jgi:hypothetical protein
MNFFMLKAQVEVYQIIRVNYRVFFFNNWLKWFSFVFNVFYHIQETFPNSKSCGVNHGIILVLYLKVFDGEIFGFVCQIRRMELAKDKFLVYSQ